MSSEQKGFPSSASPAPLALSARAHSETAASCPNILLLSPASSSMSRLALLPVRFDAGMPVISLTTSATASLSTVSGLTPVSLLSLAREAASSMRSIALSGRKRSGKHRTERLTQAAKASSVKFTPWCSSYLGQSPLSISSASSSVGSSTRIFENLLSSAASFSMYFLYSSSVVAPISLIPHLARAGFMMFAASTLPSAEPAPTMVCISSIKRITLSSSSSSMAFSLSSNSPLYLVPAITEPSSSRMSRTFLSSSGTFPSAILEASPSTIADLPTPGSPTSTGLFLFLLSSVWISLLSSASQPIIGSSLPFLACAVRSTEKPSSTGVVLPTPCIAACFESSAVLASSEVKQLFAKPVFPSISSAFSARSNSVSESGSFEDASLFMPSISAPA